MVGVMGQAVGLLPVAGTRSVVFYANILLLPSGVIFCACTGWALNSLVKFADPRNAVTSGAGLGLSVTATVLGVLGVILSWEAGAASSGQGSEVLKSPPRGPGGSPSVQLSPVTPGDGGGAPALQLRLQ
jgi:hypothetical protein